jgi:hypothetical protein
VVGGLVGNGGRRGEWRGSDDPGRRRAVDDDDLQAGHDAGAAGPRSSAWSAINSSAFTAVTFVMSFLLLSAILSSRCTLLARRLLRSAASSAW